MRSSCGSLFVAGAAACQLPGQSVPLAPCRVYAHAAHGVGRRRATHARAWAAARRMQADSQGQCGTRSGPASFKPFISWPLLGRDGVGWPMNAHISTYKN